MIIRPSESFPLMGPKSLPSGNKEIRKLLTQEMPPAKPPFTPKGAQATNMLKVFSVISKMMRG